MKRVQSGCLPCSHHCVVIGETSDEICRYLRHVPGPIANSAGRGVYDDDGFTTRPELFDRITDSWIMMAHHSRPAKHTVTKSGLRGPWQGVCIKVEATSRQGIRE
jgi:hypothetical protein